jgi:hypothetical protein
MNIHSLFVVLSIPRNRPHLLLRVWHPRLFPKLSPFSVSAGEMPADPKSLRKESGFAMMTPGVLLETVPRLENPD